MARKPGITSVYEDVLPVVDATSDEVEPAIAQEALEEAQQKNLTPDKGEDVDYTNPKVIKKFKLYRRTFLSGYKNLLALGVQPATIERLFGMGEHSFANIKQNGDEGIKKAHRAAMAELESVLTASMLKQALGYEFTEVKTTYEPRNLVRQPGVTRSNNRKPFKNSKKPSKVMVETKIEKTTKHYPGRSQLFMYYMATHFPEKWKIKGADGSGGVHFHITGDFVKGQISDLAGKYLTEPAKVIDNEVIENPDSE